MTELCGLTGVWGWEEEVEDLGEMSDLSGS